MKKESLELIEQIRFKDEKQKAIFTLCEELSDIPYRTLAGIANSLNVWEWPPELPGKPEGWEEFSCDEKLEFIDPIYKRIKMIIGTKAIARYHATVERDMTDREFEDWWDSSCKKESEEKLDDLKNSKCNGCKRCNDRDYRYLSVILALIVQLGFLLTFHIFQILNHP